MVESVVSRSVVVSVIVSCVGFVAGELIFPSFFFFFFFFFL